MTCHYKSFIQMLSMGFSVMLWGAEFWYLPNAGAVTVFTVRPVSKLHLCKYIYIFLHQYKSIYAHVNLMNDYKKLFNRCCQLERNKHFIKYLLVWITNKGKHWWPSYFEKLSSLPSKLPPRRAAWKWNELDLAIVIIVNYLNDLISKSTSL